MKYAFLVYQEEGIADAQCECRRRGVAGETIEYRDQLRQSGHLLASSAMQPAHSGMTVRVRLCQPAITGGSVAGTNAELRQVWLIEARDLNEAIRLAARMPEACLGTVEVRPLEEEMER